MFDFLRRSDDASVENGFFAVFPEYLRAFLHQAFHHLTSLALRSFIEALENLFEAFHVNLRLVEIVFERQFKFLRRCSGCAFTTKVAWTD